MTVIIAGNTTFDFSLLQSNTTLSLVSCRIAATFLYNLILTMDDEVEYVWKRRWSLASVVYLLSRYMSAVCLCYDMEQWIKGLRSCAPCDVSTLQNLGSSPAPVLYYPGLLLLLFSLILQQLRAIAIYENSKAIKIVFIVLDVLAMVAIVILKVVQPSKTPSERLTLTSVVFVPFFVVEAVTYVLCLYKTISAYRHMRGMMRGSLLEILHRNNIAYFALMFNIYVLGIFLGALGVLNGTLINFHFIASIAISGVVAPRLYIYLKKSCDQNLREQAFYSISLPVLTTFGAREDSQMTIPGGDE